MTTKFCEIMTTKFCVLDIETLGTPGECGTTHIAMPCAAFVIWKGKDVLPTIYYGAYNVSEQLYKGAKVSAGTIAFWMNEAKSNSAAQGIINILKANKAGVQIWDHVRDGKFFPANSNADVNSHINALIEVNKFNELRFYGNGPDFDMTIFEANSFHSNNGKAIVPWEFWAVRSARNSNEHDVALADIKKDAEVWAHKVFKEYNMISGTTHTPSKHNAIYDALVEAYIIAHTCEA